MSQIADMAGALVDGLEKYQAPLPQVRLGVKMMEAAGYDSESIIWALERVIDETTDFTAHRVVREEIDRLREESLIQ